MGYVKHNSIIVTDWKEERIVILHKKAQKIFGKHARLVSNIVVSERNGYASFFIAPDGSKEGWDVSQDMDDAREKFIKWLQRKHPGVDYIEVRYGGDDDAATVENSGR
jgi:hypothetical protein